MNDREKNHLNNYAATAEYFEISDDNIIDSCIYFLNRRKAEFEGVKHVRYELCHIKTQ